MANINDFGFPFTSISGDRQYSSAEWRDYFSKLIYNGLIQNDGNEMQVKPQAVPNKTVFVETGSVFIDGVMRVLTATQTLTIADNTSGNPRIDRIVARLDNTDRKIEFGVLQGTPAGSPVAPALTRTATIYELGLADIAVANGFSTIVTGNITDTRFDVALCGASSMTIGVIPPSGADASTIVYDNSASGLIAINAQDAIDETLQINDINKLWVLNQSIITVGSGNWVAPDLNNGKPYKVGVLIIGGGGAGGVVSRNATTSSNSGASGGASGYTRAIILTVNPLASYPYVVGSGGVSVPVVGRGVSTGNNGGTSSFNSVLALGGYGGVGAFGTANGADGGQGSDSMAGTPTPSHHKPIAPIYGETTCATSGGSTSIPTLPGRTVATMCINPFTNTPILASGGGTMDSGGAGGISQTCPTLFDGFSAGNGLLTSSSNATITGVSATSVGCGGGSVNCTYGSASPVQTVTAGAGKSGGIYIYTLGE